MPSVELPSRPVWLTENASISLAQQGEVELAQAAGAAYAATMQLVIIPDDENTSEEIIRTSGEPVESGMEAAGPEADNGTEQPTNVNN